MRRKQNLTDTQQVISSGEAYPLPIFMKATGWGRHALTQARRKGLRTVKVGGRCFVRGVDFMEFLGKLSQGEK